MVAWNNGDHTLAHPTERGGARTPSGERDRTDLASGHAAREPSASGGRVPQLWFQDGEIACVGES